MNRERGTGRDDRENSSKGKKGRFERPVALVVLSATRAPRCASEGEREQGTGRFLTFEENAALASEKAWE
jgi:hypothetical protein